MKRLIPFLFLFAVVAHAQTTPPATTPTTNPWAVEVGADSYNTPEGSVGVLWGGKTRSYSIVDLHPSTPIGQFTYSVRTGVEQTVYSSASIELHAIGLAGLAVSPTNIGSAFAGGAGIIVKTTKLYGWQPYVNVEATGGTAANTAQLSINVGFRHIFTQ